ncbi:MAG: ABC transporter ATP-binding protein [Thermoplasmatales archaeon]|nr:ABC transporter ATP-binding protein [Thermoplasmatales archaeon]
MVVKIRVENVSFSYDSVKVLKDITFEVDNEILGIIGPNGSGKTTLLKCISSILKPRTGTIMLDNNELFTLNRKEIARSIGVVPQTASITFPLTVIDIVLMGRNPHKKRLEFETEKDIRIAENSLKATGIRHLANRLITELSGGELQKVIVARALAQEPKILLLDEPTAHLDINHQLEILEFIRNLNTEEKITVISVFHDLNLAARFCDKLILLNQGKIYSIGNIDEVLIAENIRNVYNVNVNIEQHPVTGRPNIILISHVNNEEKHVRT